MSVDEGRCTIAKCRLVFLAIGYFCNGSRVVKRFKHIRDLKSSSSADSKNLLPTFLEKLEPRILLSADGLLSVATPDPLLDAIPRTVQHMDLLESSDQQKLSVAEQEINPQIRFSNPAEIDLIQPILTLSIKTNIEAENSELKGEVAVSIDDSGEGENDPVFDEIELATIRGILSEFTDESQVRIDNETTESQVVHIAVENSKKTVTVPVEDDTQPVVSNESKPDSEYASSIEIRGPPFSTQATTGNQIVFIDSTLNIYFQLKNADQLGVVVEVLSAGSDGIQQITNILSNYQDVSAIHIVSHGSPGQVQIGSVQLTATSIDFYAEKIQTWGDVLTPDGDILFYGCAVSQNQAGIDLIGSIARLTGADVAASIDNTGVTELGGDWILEVTTGPVEASSAVAERGLSSFHGILQEEEWRVTYDSSYVFGTNVYKAQDIGRQIGLDAAGNVYVVEDTLLVVDLRTSRLISREMLMWHIHITPPIRLDKGIRMMP